MTKQWAETPFSLIRDTGINDAPHIPDQHPAVKMAKSMALTHNVILRSINASYNQCLLVQRGTSTVKDFLYFNQALVEVLGIHHDVEEEYLFPAIATLTGDPKIMDANIQEHQEFQDGLSHFKDYIYVIQPDDYDGQKMQELLNGFGHAVEKHLHHEIPTLLQLHRYDGERLKEMGEEMQKRTLARSSKIKHLPLFVGCSDRTFCLDGQVASFPEIPTFVLHITHTLLELFHGGAWQFNPSDTFGEPRVGFYMRSSAPQSRPQLYP